jgi:hypothetical protein
LYSRRIFVRLRRLWKDEIWPDFCTIPKSAWRYWLKSRQIWAKKSSLRSVSRIRHVARTKWEWWPFCFSFFRSNNFLSWYSVTK